MSVSEFFLVRRMIFGRKKVFGFLHALASEPAKLFPARKCFFFNVVFSSLYFVPLSLFSPSSFVFFVCLKRERDRAGELRQVEKATSQHWERSKDVAFLGLLPARSAVLSNKRNVGAGYACAVFLVCFSSCFSRFCLPATKMGENNSGGRGPLCARLSREGLVLPGL